MPTVTISIGRGGGERELPMGHWIAFSNKVREFLLGTGSEIYVDAAQSIGEWEGVKEDSLTWVADFDGELLDWARGYFSELASLFEQDAIAFTIGETELIGPRENDNA